MKKRIVSILVFLIILFVMIGQSYKLFRYKDTGGGGGLQNFYNQSKNSLDVMIFGSSHAHCTVDNSYLWKEAGIASYTLTAGSQTIDSTYYFMKEAFKTQKPKVAFVETYMVGSSKPPIETGNALTDMTNLYRTDLNMKLSPSYVSQVLEQKKNYCLSDETTFQLLLQYPIIHARYTELSKKDVSNDEWFKKGYQGTLDAMEVHYPKAASSPVQLSEFSKEYIDRIVTLCSENNVDLVFFRAPFAETEKESALGEAVQSYLDEISAVYFDFNDRFGELGLDIYTDFRDYGHLNNYGAEKVTSFLCSYINEHYDLPDHRNEAAYDSWNLDAAFVEDFALISELDHITDLNEYLDRISLEREKYDIILLLSGQYALLQDAYLESLTRLGINEESFLTGGAFVLHEGNFVYWSGENSDFSYKGKLGKKNCLIQRSSQKDLIQIDSRTIDTSENGVTIVLYDPKCDYLLDSIKVNIHNGLIIER